MVARNEHYLQAPHGLCGAEQEVVKEFLGACRGVGGVEHVARHDEHIGLLLFHHLQEPAEEMAVFVRTVVAVEIVAEVPVGCMEYLHLEILIFSGRKVTDYCQLRYFCGKLSLQINFNDN